MKTTVKTHIFPESGLIVSAKVLFTPHQRDVVSIGQGQAHRRTARNTGAFWLMLLAPTTLETTRRRPFFQVFRKGRLPALASPL